jgi:hypothetical protein
MSRLIEGTGCACLPAVGPWAVIVGVISATDIIMALEETE